ncbi:MAG: hypothetical protein DRJ09_09730 [Bacteroidetes bacterium]|nr:MAG: hypothetical protein DRJ09_09730 [Bacteroidota bacterium]
MGIANYFSKDEDKRTQFIFNLIAPAYSILDKGTFNDFKIMAELLDDHYSLKGKSVLDVGSGTGSWISALNQHGLSQAVGADFSEKMIRQARQKHPEIEFYHQHGENLSAFDDNSFDVVTATFVLHGMKKEKRARVLNEMKRVARHRVIIHDFYNNRQFIVQLLEFLERSDYVYFQKHFKEEIKSFFTKTEIIKGENGNALYMGYIG